MTRLKIDLVSDVVCPFCPIGYAHFAQARERLADEIAFDVEWHPFVLNPDVPPEGRPILAHLAQKYGRSEAQAETSQREIMAAAADAGLNFDQALVRRSWNTFDVHRVLAWAKTQGCDAAFNEALFEAYFGHAENPTDETVLRRIAVSLGLDPEAVSDILAGDRHADVVRDELARYRALGVSSVPSFVVDERYLLAGAQPPDAFVDAFRRIAADKTPA